MKKSLPIKFIAKRKVDEQLKEAGGSKELPKWVMQGDSLAQRSRNLTGSMSRIDAEFQTHERENHQLPMIMTTTIAEKALAKTHRGAVVDMLNSDNMSNVIGMESVMSLRPQAVQTEKNSQELKEKRRILSVVNSDKLINNIKRALQDTENNAKLISSIEDMEPFEAISCGYNPKNKMYRVRLIDYQDPGRNQLAHSLFKRKCAENRITIARETRYSPDMRLYRVSLDCPSDMETVCGFEGIFSIEESVPIRAEEDAFDDESVPAVKQPKAGVSYPTVGVLDSGIEKNAYLSPWLLDAKEIYYPNEFQDRSHGSMVASILEYSDEINKTNYTSTDGVMMLETVIVPDSGKENVYPEDVLDHVRDAVERHRDIKIWTMSVGTTEECSPDSFSEYGMALDNIADENGVLIIKSAGNSVAFMKNAQPERIAQMADSVRSLVIGSIAGEKSEHDLADIGMPSPFSRKGPGPAYIIKPDLVAYGGNAGLRPDGQLTTTGVRVLDSHGKSARAEGTSFSTPWIARIAAELHFLLEEEFDPLLIKALMVHNSGYPAGESMNMDDKKNFMGFGMPPGTADILHNSENEITLVLRDKLSRENFIDILDFPFSHSMIGTDGMYHGQIILTMVCSPILRPSEGPEYCQSDIKVAFGTMDGIKKRDTSKRTIRNPHGAENAANVMRANFYKKRCFDVLEETTFGRERTLIRLGRKFHPIKKYAIDLDEMTDANKRKYLSGNRRWYMKVEPLFRDAIEREAKKSSEVLEQEFCILLTIRDPSGKAPVYNEVTQQLQEKNFVYSDVRIKNDVREHIRIEGDSNG